MIVPRGRGILRRPSDFSVVDIRISDVPDMGEWSKWGHRLAASAHVALSESGDGHTGVIESTSFGWESSCLISYRSTTRTERW